MVQCDSWKLASRFQPLFSCVPCVDSQKRDGIQIVYDSREKNIQQSNVVMSVRLRSNRCGQGSTVLSRQNSDKYRRLISSIFPV